MNARSGSRSPFASTLAALGVLASTMAGCGDETARARRAGAIARIDVEPLHTSVVEHVAARDGISMQEAHRRVADVLRLVAAARAESDRAARGEQGDDDLVELAGAHRVRHLERAARARLWLQTDFEARHRPQDIPNDDPILAMARSSRRHVHPRLHMVCQVIAMPPEALDIAQREARAADPHWRRRAEAVLTPVARRLQRLPAGDPEPCKLIQRWMLLESSPDAAVRFRAESGGFDLEACNEHDADGRCVQPQFSPAWTEAVARAQGPGFLPPFFTEFGLHLVYVVEILPPRLLDDPETEGVLRQAVHEAWQRQSFAAYLQRIRENRAVRIAPPSALGERDPPSSKAAP